MRSSTRDHGCSLDDPLLHPGLRNRNSRLVARFCGNHFDPYEFGVRCWWCFGWLVAYQTRWIILAVCLPCLSPLFYILTYSRACILSYISFTLTLLLLALISLPTTPPPLYFLTVFLNGLSTGAALNYTLAHLLHLTPPSTHFISTSLLTTFRGFAGSFGSAIGGGLFVRVLKSTLEEGFERNGGLDGKEGLVRRLLGSPALVKGLKGVEKSVAVGGYTAALKALFLAGVGLAGVMVFIQAATGWKAPDIAVVGSVDRDDGGPLAMVDDEEEWEEGMENGV